MKKKLANENKIIFFILSLFVYYSVCFANIDIKQGENITYDSLSKIYIGISKNEVLKNFGMPVLLTNCDDDCFCYYCYDFPFNKSDEIKYNYILMFFDKSLLVSYYFRF